MRASLRAVAVQLAYVACLQGRKKEAVEAYTRILKLKPTDAVSAAVAANNLVAERGAHELFDGLKRLDKMLERGGAGSRCVRVLQQRTRAVADAARPCSTRFVDALETRLSKEQREALSFNRATLLLHSNKARRMQSGVRPYLTCLLTLSHVRARCRRSSAASCWARWRSASPTAVQAAC